MFKRLKNTTGFTIIEVVIVLAIAGLIFAVVFIAVPQLQAAQRDSARQNEMGRFQAAVNQWQSNHNGDLPRRNSTDFNRIVSDYMNDDFDDPIGGPYSLGSQGNVSYENAVVAYYTDRRCHSNGTQVTSTGQGDRSYALVYELEQGGRLCVDNR